MPSLARFVHGLRRRTRTRMAAVFAAVALLFPLIAFAAPPARVLVYGDSNTWGWEPVQSGFPTRRYVAADRWPEVVRRALGERAEVVVDALSGRTVDIDHVAAVGKLAPEAFNGLRGIAPAVARELPLDLVVVMLGTNDVANDQNRSPAQIAAGMAELVRTIRGIDGGVLTAYPAPRVLVVVPPPIGDSSRTPIGARIDAQSQGKSQALASAYQEALEGIDGVSVVDAGEATGVIQGVDGIHLTATQQHALGVALAARIEETLASQPQETP